MNNRGAPISDQPDRTAPQAEGELTSFFETVHETYQRAKQAGGAIDRFYAIGGHSIRLCFAGPVLVSKITPALDHLAVPAIQHPDLTVCLFDSASTGADIPPPPWSTGVYLGRGDVHGCSSDRIQVAFQLGASILSLLDNSQDLAVYWTRDGAQLPYYESGSPLRVILHWWMSQQGLQYVHGGAIGTSEGGVLLAGKGGSGKSTTALASLESSLFYASDDYCLLGSNPEPYVYSLYNSAKVEADHIRRFPHLVPLVSNTERLEQEKALLFLHQHLPHKVVRGFPVRAILLPKITGRSETTLAPASPIAALTAIAPNTIFQLPGAGRKAFRTLARFVRCVRCYSLGIGTDLRQIPAVISELLSGGEP